MRLSHTFSGNGSYANSFAFDTGLPEVIEVYCRLLLGKKD